MNGLGGGSYCGFGSNCLFSNSSFENNFAKEGGGAWCLEIPQTSCQFFNCTLNSNTAEYGGAFYFRNSINSLISGGNFLNNRAFRDGGVLYFNSSGVINVVDSIVVNNESPSSIFFMAPQGGVIIVKNLFAHDNRGESLFFLNSR